MTQNKMMDYEEAMDKLMSRPHLNDFEIEKIEQNPTFFGKKFEVFKLLYELEAIDSEFVNAGKRGWDLTIDEIYECYMDVKNHYEELEE